LMVYILSKTAVGIQWLLELLSYSCSEVELVAFC